MVTNYPSSYVTIAGQNIPCYKWTIEEGTYGAIGHATLYCTISSLQAIGLDIPQITSQGTGVPVQITLNGNQMFGGNYTHAWFHFHRDECEFLARDAAAVLADKKQSLASLNYQNQTVSQLVTQICVANGLGAAIQISNDPLVGTVVQSDGAAANSSAVMATKPINLWGLLVFLARMVGATLLTQPNGTLTMQDASVSQGSNNYTWMPTPNPQTGASASGSNPILELDVLHQPEQNKNFSVKVISYHGPSMQLVQQTVTVNGTTVQVDTQTKTTTGKFVASTGANGPGGLLGNLGVPEYIYVFHGKTPDQAQQFAAGVAHDIAQKLLFVTCVVLGNSNIKPRQQLLISEAVPGSLLGFSNLPLFVSTVTHQFEVPQGESGGTGFLTSITALNLPNGVQAE